MVSLDCSTDGLLLLDTLHRKAQRGKHRLLVVHDKNCVANSSISSYNSFGGEEFSAFETANKLGRPNVQIMSRKTEIRIPVCCKPSVASDLCWRCGQERERQSTSQNEATCVCTEPSQGLRSHGHT